MSLPYVRRRLTHALQTLARHLGAPPASPTPLTSEWISTRCEGLDASAAVVEVALDEESGENGAVARVALGGVRLVVKRPPASPAARAVAAIQQWYAREVHWYAALAPIAGVRCPRCHCARYDALTGEYVLVLEDLRAAGCRPLAVADCQDALEAVRTLGRLHGRFAGAFDDDARREIVRGPLPIMPITLALASPIEKFFRDCWKAVRGERRYALAELLADRGEAAGPAAISLLDALAAPGAYASMIEALAAPPRTLLHGDFRPENMMVEDATARSWSTTGNSRRLVMAPMTSPTSRPWWRTRTIGAASTRSSGGPTCRGWSAAALRRPATSSATFVMGASSRSRPSSWVRLLPATTRPRSRRTAGGFGASLRRRWTGAPW